MRALLTAGTPLAWTVTEIAWPAVAPDQVLVEVATAGLRTCS
ncbi:MULTISPECIES: hypothetical protein [unclassified Streptomyces]|nr:MULTISPECIES: hypothetical protein [unclassified Streptomyces]MCX4834258.1 hypothetical protein [Streptomyces sp. NBC_01016]